MASKNMRKGANTNLHKIGGDAHTERIAYVPVPSVPTTRIPSFEPTRKIKITSWPTSSPSTEPSTPPSGMPTHIAVPPKVTKVELDDDTEQIAIATCEDSFVDLENLIPNISIPPLENVLVEYDYEAFILDSVEKETALMEVEYQMFKDVLSASPLIIDEEPATSDCSRMLADLFEPQGGASRVLNDNNVWRNYMGWKNSPADTFKGEDSECVNDNNLIVANATCYPINGKVTAQVPIDVDLPTLFFQQQIMQRIKTGVENDQFQTASIPTITFVGSSKPMEGGEDINRDNVLNPDIPNDDQGNNLLSAFGISAIVAFSAAVTVILSIIGLRYRGKTKQREFENIQKNAIALGAESKESQHSANGPDDVKINPNDYVQASPNSVEVVDMEISSPLCCGIIGAAPVQDGTNDKQKGFSMGAFLQGKDDISYDSGGDGISGNSAISVGTEDFGNGNEKVGLVRT